MKSITQSRLLPKIDYFREVKLFSGLSDEQLKKMMEIMGLKEIEADNFIIKEGDSDNTLYILLEGEVEVSKSLVLPEWIQAGQKQEKSLIRLSEKHHPFFGEMAMFEDEPERSASIKAIQKCVMVTLSKDSIESVTEEDPRIGLQLYFNIASELVERLRRANKDILKLTTAFTLALEG